MPLVATILTAVGTGLSVWGSASQANAAEAVAAVNARAQQQNAAFQASSLQAQATVARNTAVANNELQRQQAAAKFSNAASIENRARAQEMIDRVNLQKHQTEYQKLTASNRVKIAASGVVETSGTPLDIAAKLAGEIQRAQEDRNFGMQLQTQGIYREAAFERLGGKLALAGASLDQYSALAQANLMDASAQATLLTGQRQAEITRLSGAATAQGLQFQGLGTLFSGASKVAGDVWDFKDQGAWG